MEFQILLAPGLQNTQKFGRYFEKYVLILYFQKYVFPKIFPHGFAAIWAGQADEAGGAPAEPGGPAPCSTDHMSVLLAAASLCQALVPARIELATALLRDGRVA